MERFGAIVIGAGQAGPSLALRLAAAGQRVALVEQDQLGGTCVNTGCTPTKTLIASARAAHVAKRAAEFGVLGAEPTGFDWPRAQARAREVVASSRRGLERSLERRAVLRGRGRLTSPETVEVGGRELGAERIFLDVGARARVPRIQGIESVPYLDNASILELDALPRHLLVVGGGPLGLEFAQMFRRFGSEVTVLQKGPRLLARHDEDVSASASRSRAIRGA